MLAIGVVATFVYSNIQADECFTGETCGSLSASPTSYTTCVGESQEPGDSETAHIFSESTAACGELYAGGVSTGMECGSTISGTCWLGV